MEPGLFLVDAFANGPLTGNPAAVCLLESHADESWMQRFAAEMNQAETAYVVPRPDGDFDLRWFTPKVEVDLCGHATLASAHVLFVHRGFGGPSIRFHTNRGMLIAERHGELIRLDFPATEPKPCPCPDGLEKALGVQPAWIGKSPFDLFVEVDSDAAVRSMAPEIRALGSLPVRGIIVTARSEDPEFDFVSRFFAPAAGVDEDHATGSAHCALAPYWAARLGKTRMRAFQASFRGGWLEVEHAGGRVYLDGMAATVVGGRLA